MPRPAWIGGLSGLSIVAFLLAVSGANSAIADPSRPGHAGPDETDIRIFLGCSEMATTRVLSFEEALECAQAFTRIKLSFVEGVGPDDLERLAPPERAAVSQAAYRRYLEWLSVNSARIEALKDAPPSLPDLAAN